MSVCWATAMAIQGPVDDVSIFPGQTGKGVFLVRRPAVTDQFPHGQAARGTGILRQNSQGRSQAAAVLFMDGYAVEQDLPFQRRLNPANRLEQRRLAAAIGPDEGRDLPGRDAQRQIADDDVVVIAGVQMSCFQFHR